MENLWLVIESGPDYEQYHWSTTPKEQIATATKLIKMSQNHRAVDDVCRIISIIPDPYRSGTIEDFVQAYKRNIK